MNKTNRKLKLGNLIIASFLMLSFACSNQKQLSQKAQQNPNNKYIQLSMDLLTAAKNKTETSAIQEELKTIEPDTLANYLITDEQKKAFWINVYNAHIQIILEEHPEYFENRGKFFGTSLFIVAKQALSFDQVEHGYIRGSKIKLSLGLLKDPFVGKVERQFRTNKEDGRVHFALNCGAKSCPLVAIYDAKNFNTKIDEVAKNFLNKMSTYNKQENKVITTPLFSWFRGDFDGKQGIKNMLKKYEVIPQESDPKVEYDDYDWTLSLGNYYEK
jgi:hypothetical protein